MVLTSRGFGEDFVQIHELARLEVIVRSCSVDEKPGQSKHL